MIRHTLALIVATLAGFGGVQATDAAGTSPGALAAVAVKWDIGNDDWSKTCRIDLKTVPAAHGLVVVKGDGCSRAFPVMAKVASWTLEGAENIALLDASGTVVLRFVLNDGDNMYTPDPEVDGISTIALALE